MAYIGTKPTIGNFQICDAISVVNGQAAYTMQVGSVNVIPQSSNHMIVSLNSTIQRSGGASPSFTVSGSTITFASNLVTGDVIDFIHILGDVLDLGVPSDATVTDAKTNFVSTSSAAGLQIKGDGTTDGTLQLNCSQNSHGIKLKSPPHSAGASYTLTFPNNDGDANQVLTTDGSGVLSFAAAGGITVADQWRLTANLTATNGTISSNLEQVDTAPQGTLGSAMTVSSGIFTFPSTGFYLVGFHGYGANSSSADNMTVIIKGTTNNSSYVSIAETSDSAGGAAQDQIASFSTQSIVDVTNTTNVKVLFETSSFASGSYLAGSTDTNYSAFHFIRLGDT